jgi:hypothetical protein
LRPVARCRAPGAEEEKAQQCAETNHDLASDGI